MADTFTVERSETIQAPPERIYEVLSDFHRWTDWSPWEDVDPELERVYSGAEAGTGSVYDWSGNRKAGKGRMEIVETDRPSRVTIRLDFIKPFKATNMTTFHLTPVGEGTRVDWTMTGPKTLLTKVMGIFTSMDKMVGPDFEKGLVRLKAVAERSAS